MRGYNNLNGEWRALGTAPLAAVKLARVALRWRFEKPGYTPVERVTAHDDFFGAGLIDVTLPKDVEKRRRATVRHARSLERSPSPRHSSRGRQT